MRRIVFSVLIAIGLTASCVAQTGIPADARFEHPFGAKVHIAG